MVTLKVYSKYQQINYRSRLCSNATFFTIITKILIIILPFIFAYNSKGFWLKRDVFHEQPNINYKYEYIFIAETDKLNLPILCSNMINFEMKTDFAICTTIKVREIDENDDGKFDELYFTLTVDSSQILNVLSVTLFLSLDYKIQTVCPLQMQTSTIIQHFHNSPGVKLNLAGDLLFNQIIPVPCNSQVTNNQFNSSLFNVQSQFELWDIMKEHFERKISTKIGNSYTLWISGSSTTFTVNINLRYPEQSIYYQPNFWQVIKFAWIQYLSLFVIISWLINKIQDYVFTNKLVLYHVDKPDKIKLF